MKKLRLLQKKLKKMWANDFNTFVFLVFVLSNLLNNFLFGFETEGMNPLHTLFSTLLPFGAFSLFTSNLVYLFAGVFVLVGVSVWLLELGTRRYLNTDGRRVKRQPSLDFRIAALIFPKPSFEQGKVADLIESMRQRDDGITGNILLQTPIVLGAGFFGWCSSPLIVCFGTNAFYAIQFLLFVGLVSAHKFKLKIHSWIFLAMFMTMSYAAQLQVLMAMVCSHMILIPELMRSPSGKVDFGKLRNSLYSATVTFLVDGWGMSTVLCDTLVNIVTGKVDIVAPFATSFTIVCTLTSWTFACGCMWMLVKLSRALRISLHRKLTRYNNIWSLTHWWAWPSLYIACTCILMWFNYCYGSAITRWALGSLVPIQSSRGNAAIGENLLDVGGADVVGPTLIMMMLLMGLIMFCIITVLSQQMISFMGILHGKAALFDINVSDTIISQADDAVDIKYVIPKKNVGRAVADRINQFFTLLKTFRSLIFDEFFAEGFIVGDSVTWNGGTLSGKVIAKKR
jgi:hypothetical protein